MKSSLLRYPGGKTKLSPVIMKYLSPLLNESDSFCEPFVGGGSILLEVARRYPKHKLYINDKDYGIYSIWKVLSSSNQKDIEDLCEYIKKEPTIDYFYQLRESSPKDVIESAYQAIFFNRCCFSGINITREKKDKDGNIKIFKSNPIGGKDQKSKYKVNCRYNSKKIIKQIKEINNLLANRTFVDNKGVDDYLNGINDIPTYCDPPYWYKAENLYNTYMSKDEHKKLSLMLMRKINWVLSYDNCQDIRTLYGWANLLQIDAKYSITSNNTEWKENTELIILPY
jgi:DNA adenine methylase